MVKHFFDINPLVSVLAKISKDCPIERFDWYFPDYSPMDIPENITSGYGRNIYLKDNFHGIINDDQLLDSHYWVVHDWGGIKAFKRHARNDKRIHDFITELNKGKLTKKTFDAISSVSKIASFMQPDKYAVYDSRVIYSLNWLLFNYANSQSMFPQPVGRNLELVKYDMQTIFRLSGRNVEYISHKIAFQEYCALVKDLSVRVYGEGSKPYMVEMLLFMIAPTWIVSEIARSVTVSINLLK